ncbi:CBS domain-containing protein [Deinococcus aestuarii]|uniref:CBS domain-containing protein n=1 Tax=Deinococcus aestuarii TaxID=2774531 RepID=UPI001C0D2058|nr:CBS domain-containing protein [Deinococcus aestuarii]
MLVQDAMHTRVITADPHESLPDAVVKMETLRIKRLPVLLEGQLVGLLTDGEVRRHLPALHEGLSPWDFAHRAGRVRVRDAMRRPVLTTTPEEPLEHAVRVMLERRVGGLPVLNDAGGLVGMLTLTDVLAAALRETPPTWGAVQEHMTATTVNVEAGAPAGEAAARLRVTGLRVLPVLEGGRLVGVIHERDLGAAVDRAKAAHGDTVLGDQFFLKGKAARDLMRPPGGQVPAGAPLREAVSRMLEQGVHGLPVLGEGERLLGVVTVSDVLHAWLGQGAPGRG